MSAFRDRKAIAIMLRDIADSIDCGDADPVIMQMGFTMPPITDREYDGAVKSTEIHLKLFGVHVYEHTGFKVES